MAKTATSETSAPRLLLTIEQAAARFGVGRSTMNGLVLDGEVESVRIGRLRRIPHDALTAYLDQLRGWHPLTAVDG